MSPAALRSAADDPSIQRRFFANAGRFLRKAVQGRRDQVGQRVKRRSQPSGFVATSTLEDPRHVRAPEARLAGDFYPCAPGWFSLSVDAVDAYGLSWTAVALLVAPTPGPHGLVQQSGSAKSSRQSGSPHRKCSYNIRYKHQIPDGPQAALCAFRAGNHRASPHWEEGPELTLLLQLGQLSFCPNR